MMIRNLILSTLVGLIWLLIGFFIINIIGAAWYQYAYPHDGQGGLAAFVLGLYFAPLCGIVGLTVDFAFRHKRTDG